MSWSLIPLYYLIIGGAFFSLVYFYSDFYRFTLKRALLIIKTAGQKSKQAQSRMQQEYREKYNLEQKKQLDAQDAEEVRQTQAQYSQELDNNAEKKYQEIQNNPNKATRTVFGLIIAWPLVVFVVGMATVLASVYLTEQELLDVDAQL